MRIEVVLPWPSRELSPNARCHWAKKAKAVKAYRQACWTLTKAAKITIDPAYTGQLHLWLTFMPPDRRNRDDDNIIASFKAGRDGLAQALGVDDSRFRSLPWVSDQIGGMVKVVITEGFGEQPA